MLILAAAALLPVLGRAECQAPIVLKATYNSGQIQLDWLPHWTQTAWRLETDTDLAFGQPEILGIVEVSSFTYIPQFGQTGARFFRVIGVDGPALGDSAMVEDFEWELPLESWPGEDVEPEGWEYDDSTVYHGQVSLHLFDNTVKYREIGTPELEMGSAFRVAARCDGVADRQMIGFADSLNVIWYVLWGTRGGYPDSPGQSGQEEVSTYQGYFPEQQWVQFVLPVGQDFQGKYGYLPSLCEVIWANESDEDAGEVWFDQLEEITGLAGRRPAAVPDYTVLDTTPDSILAAFSDLGGSVDVTRRWNFGEGTEVLEDEPEAWLDADRIHRVTLWVEGAEGVYNFAGLEVDPGAAAPRPLSFGFVGDVMTARGYEADGGIIETMGVEAIFDSVRQEFQDPDLMMVNLECDYTTADSQHPTKGICFKSHPDNIAGIVSAGVEFASLANNHVFDYMIPGMEETMSVLDGAGVYHTGCGLNSVYARRPRFLSSGGQAVGVLAFSDRTGNYNNYQPFLDAGPSRAGFALWSRGDMQSTIPELRDDVDWLLVQLHSGNEYSTAPSFALRDRDAAPPQDDDLPWDPEYRGLFARDLLPDQSERSLRQEAVDLGADLVIAHHPHILQGVELYEGRLIAHSLGNFVMDLSYAETMTTAMVRVDAVEQQFERIGILPAFLDRYIPRFARGELAESILDHVTDMSLEFDTWVHRDPGAEEAWVVLDTTAVTFDGLTTTDMLPLEEDGAYRCSPPHRLSGDGYVVELTCLDQLSGLQIRTGRNIHWWGNMEDEGSRIWDINSEHEWYETAVAYRGERSIQHQEDNTNTVYTYYTNRVPMDDDYEYSIAGWIRTEGASSCTIQMRYYTQRTSAPVIGTEFAGDALAGTQDWTYQWKNLSLAEGTRFYQVRLGLTAGFSVSNSWYDDVEVLRWDEWQDLEPLVLLELRFPNDADYVQLRHTGAEDELELSHRREWILPVAAAGGR